MSEENLNWTNSFVRTCHFDVLLPIAITSESNFHRTPSSHQVCFFQFFLILTTTLTLYWVILDLTLCQSTSCSITALLPLDPYLIANLGFTSRSWWPGLDLGRSCPGLGWLLMRLATPNVLFSPHSWPGTEILFNSYVTYWGYVPFVFPIPLLTYSQFLFTCNTEPFHHDSCHGSHWYPSCHC